MDYKVVGHFVQSRSKASVGTGQIGNLSDNKAYLEVTLKANINNTNAIYIGATSGVTTANGYPLQPGEVLKLKLSTPKLIYAVSSVAKQIIHILET